MSTINEGKYREDDVPNSFSEIKEEIEENVKPWEQRIQEVGEALEPIQQQAKAQVGEVVESVQHRAKSAATSGKDEAVAQLSDISAAIRATSSQFHQRDKSTVAHYTEKLADQVDRISHYLDEKEVDQLVSETKNFALRRPELFLGGAFAVGLVLARFLKSSGRQDIHTLEDRSQSNYYQSGARSNYSSTSSPYREEDPMSPYRSR